MQIGNFHSFWRSGHSSAKRCLRCFRYYNNRHLETQTGPSPAEEVLNYTVLFSLISIHHYILLLRNSPNQGIPDLSAINPVFVFKRFESCICCSTGASDFISNIRSASHTP